jgi:hypothetical protein
MTKLPSITFPYCLIVSAWLCGGVWATTGPLTITTNTTLSEDHEGNIVIAADWITLNCNGHAIKALLDGTVAHGIELRGRTGVTVENWHIRATYRERWEVASEKAKKIYEEIYGIFILRAQSITINNCIIEGWGVGIKLGVPEVGQDEGGNHRIWHNELRSNIADGLDCDGSDANDYWDNESHDNGQNGFEFDRCSNSNDWGAPFIFENNRAYHNYKHGFSFDSSNNIRLHANTSTCNGWDSECPKSANEAKELIANGKAKDWPSNCGGTNKGSGLRIDSVTCLETDRSRGIQADWNDWGEADDGTCTSNAGGNLLLRKSEYDAMESVYGFPTNRCNPQRM